MPKKLKKKRNMNKKRNLKKKNTTDSKHKRSKIRKKKLTKNSFTQISVRFGVKILPQSRMKNVRSYGVLEKTFRILPNKENDISDHSS